MTFQQKIETIENSNLSAQARAARSFIEALHAANRGEINEATKFRLGQSLNRTINLYGKP